jgi:DNA invertase Pin-like site-specific DNA recombinase
MEPKRKVLALLRVSTKDQDLQRQQTDIEFHCERFNLEVVNSYGFDGITGVAVQNTPRFKKMLEELRQPDIAGVVLSTLDRFFRPEHLDAYSTFKIFRIEKKLLFCDVSRQLDVRLPEDRTLIVSQLENAAMERQRIKFRTHGKKEQLILDPTISITKLPQGVRHIKDVAKYGPKTKKGYFEYTRYAFDKIKPAYERVAAGETIRSVAADLGFSGETTLRGVLCNKWWLGINERIHQQIITYDEETGRKILSKRGRHPKPIINHTNLCETPLVSEALFNKIQDILAVHRNNWYQVRSNTNDFLGTGFLECKCGCPMYLKFDARNGKPPVYVCSSYRTKNGPCGNSRLRADRTDKQIAWNAWQYLTDKKFMRYAMEEAENLEEVKQRRKDVEVSQATLEGLEKQKKAIQRMIAVAEDDEDALAMYARSKAEIAEAKMQLAKAKAQAEPFGTNDVDEISTRIAERMTRFLALAMPEKRAILAEVIEKIRLTKDGRAIFVVRGGVPVQSDVVEMDDRAADVMVKAIDVGMAAIGKTREDFIEVVTKYREAEKVAKLEQSSR